MTHCAPGRMGGRVGAGMHGHFPEVLLRLSSPCSGKALAENGHCASLGFQLGGAVSSACPSHLGKALGLGHIQA